MQKNRWLVAVALACTAGLTVGCDDDDDDLEDVIDERIDDLDLDDDFVVTRSEWNNAFIVFDTDDDRVLVLDEFRFNGAAFDLADFNNDGFVTEDEWDDFLDEVDENHDDVLDEIEFDPFL
jgi:hypothetical protein